MHVIIRQLDRGYDMSDITVDSLSSQYLDVLKEIGNIGAGNAMTALAQMLGRKVDMKVPQVMLLDFPQVGEAMGGEETLMAGIYFKVDGDITGSIMFLLEMESAKALVAMMMGTEPSEEGFSDIEASALKEIGNIIAGSYLNSLALLTNLKIFPSVPDMTMDMAGAILSVPAIEFGETGDRMLFIQTHFFDEAKIQGYFILVPEVSSYEKILKTLGMA